MKTARKNNLIVAGIGALFLAGVFTIAYLYEPKLHLTTPEKDAHKIGEMAEVIRTESDLRELEKLAYEYELAYRHTYNGAKAMHFKSLVEPHIIAAGDRREAIRAEEDRLAEAQCMFAKRLNDIDAAWRMDLGSDEELGQIIREHEEGICAIEATIAELLARKQQLATDAWSGPSGTLDQKCLDEIGVVEEQITACKADIEKHNLAIEHIRLAYRLQKGAEFVDATQSDVVVEEAEVEETMEW